MILTPAAARLAMTHPDWSLKRCIEEASRA